jgi:hypothetical protein
VSDTEHPPEQTPDEGVEITSTGLVHLIIDGTDYWLRRPKIGEMKRLEELIVAAAKLQTDRLSRLAERVEEAAAVAEAAKAAHGADSESAAVEASAEANDVVEAAEAAEDDMAAIVEGLLNAWREVVRTLERERRTLPDENDDLPPWLANFDLFTEMRKAWRTLPWLAAPRK